MISKLHSGPTITLFIVFVALVLFGTFPSDAVSVESAEKNIQNDIQPITFGSPGEQTKRKPQVERP